MIRPKWKRILTAVFTAALALSCSCLRNSAAAEPGEETEIYIATDLHYIAPELTDNGPGFTRLVEAADGKDMLRCETITDSFLEQVVRGRPDALVLAGDLSFNGEETSLRELAGKLEQVREAGIPVFVIPGNHDLNCSMAAKFTGDTYTPVASVSPEGFAEIYRNCGYGTAVSRDPSSLSYTAQIGEGIRLLMIDVNGNAKPGECTEETLTWAEKQLRQAEKDGARVVAVSHQTLLQHSFLSAGFMIPDAGPLLSLYESHGVLCNLSGHMHIQHIAFSDGEFPDIAGSALITAPNQFGVLSIGRETVSYRTERTETGCEKESEQFLYETAVRQAEKELQALGTGDEADGLADYFASVNLAYIAGRTAEVDWADPRYETWRSLPSLVGYYLQTVRDDRLDNHCLLTLEPKPR